MYQDILYRPSDAVSHKLCKINRFCKDAIRNFERQYTSSENILYMSLENILVNVDDSLIDEMGDDVRNSFQ